MADSERLVAGVRTVVQVDGGPADGASGKGTSGKGKRGAKRKAKRKRTIRDAAGMEIGCDCATRRAIVASERIDRIRNTLTYRR
jgi:hypothetical protein